MKDEPHKYEKDWVGEAVRLEIPLQSVANLKRVAEVLRGLAARFDSLYAYPYEAPLETILEVKRLTRRAGKDLSKIRSRGRPKKGRQFVNTPKI